jgi:L-lactate dehydrogenase complex protein LldG
MAVEASSAPSALWSAFTARAELLGAAVIRSASEETAAGVLSEAAGSEFACTAGAARRFPRLAPGASSAENGQATEVVAPGEFAVAETGSVALDEPRVDRGMCFLAERLWLVVPEHEIVPTLDVAMQRLRDLVANGSPHPLLMSGPSRSADIERVITVGVHGPRAVVIMVVGQG